MLFYFFWVKNIQAGWVKHAGLTPPTDTSSAHPKTLWFSTMHRAKGLEFDQVIAISTLKTELSVAETADTRRLLYVALTRAKRRAGLISI